MIVVVRIERADAKSLEPITAEKLGMMLYDVGMQEDREWGGICVTPNEITISFSGVLKQAVIDDMNKLLPDVPFMVTGFRDRRAEGIKQYELGAGIRLRFDLEEE